jgi:hypothetical protein
MRPGILGKLIIPSFIINSIVRNNSVSTAGFRFDGNYYFLGDMITTTPPVTITAIPMRGDQLRWCGLFAVIFKLPISTTFSLVKKVIAVKMVSANPRTMINIPAFFIKE